ncbi:hypothetical protein V6N12_063280 [Hibiscus sabdariffa]|uniref:Uncharacterized protein n=1 Tax=Hibiscus sabdariffa TaxID=183260 RepID=A0ABR2FB92_9ROSI
MHFGILWLHRNAFVFCHASGDFDNIFARTEDLVAKSVCNATLSRLTPPNRGNTLIDMEQWIPPHQQSTKVNSDGARNVSNDYFCDMWLG